MAKLRKAVGIIVFVGAVATISKNCRKALARRKQIAADFRTGLEGKTLREGLTFTSGDYEFIISDLVNDPEEREYYNVQVISRNLMHKPTCSSGTALLKYYLPTDSVPGHVLSWPPHRSRKGIDWF